ncbi:hypothetical protein D5086_029747 [Populus alba]|uniref:Uncharacterized protein n=3 Tax=Populus TaxID=3689 RepID=A0A4U5NN03_POPAL|nr:hypothetical protein NC653_036820 [Populus alba x Populus x berolinensis]TKR84316.1 hypothetical protein D5086_0000259010 [Populus alba]
MDQDGRKTGRVPIKYFLEEIRLPPDSSLAVLIAHLCSHQYPCLDLLGCPLFQKAVCDWSHSRNDIRVGLGSIGNGYNIWNHTLVHQDASEQEAATAGKKKKKKKKKLPLLQKVDDTHALVGQEQGKIYK